MPLFPQWFWNPVQLFLAYWGLRVRALHDPGTCTGRYFAGQKGTFRVRVAKDYVRRTQFRDSHREDCCFSDVLSPLLTKTSPSLFRKNVRNRH